MNHIQSAAYLNQQAAGSLPIPYPPIGETSTGLGRDQSNGSSHLVGGRTEMQPD